jgi:phosphate/sulfate permease
MPEPVAPTVSQLAAVMVSPTLMRTVTRESITAIPLLMLVVRRVSPISVEIRYRILMKAVMMGTMITPTDVTRRVSQKYVEMESSRAMSVVTSP